MLTEQNNLERSYELLRGSLQFLRAAGQVHEFCIDLEDYHRASGRRSIDWQVSYHKGDGKWIFIRGCTLEEVSEKVQEHFRVVPAESSGPVLSI